MLRDLTAENRALCFEDSVAKPIFLYLYRWFEDPIGESGGNYVFYKIEEAIVSESMEYSEGLLEGEVLEFGSIVIPSMTIRWANPGESYKDMLVIPVQQIGTQYIKYFDGFIEKEEVSDDNLQVSGTIYPVMYKSMDEDLKPFLKDYDGGMSLCELIGTYLNGTHIWTHTDDILKDQPSASITVPSFANDVANVSKGKTVFDKYDTFTVQDLLKAAGEFMGCAIRVKCKEVLDSADLLSLKDIQPYPSTPIAFVDLPNTTNIQRSLPSGYTQVSCIWAEDAASIDTGVYPNDSTEVEITFSQGLGGGGNVIGIYPGYGESNAFRMFEYNKCYYLDYGSGDGYNRISTPYLYELFQYDVVKTIRFGNRYIQVNGVTQASGSHVSFTQKTDTMKIGNSVSKTYQRFYACKIFQNYSLVRNYIPCLDSNGNAGLYDLVNNHFEYHANFKASEFLNVISFPYYITSRKETSKVVAFNSWAYRAEIPDTDGTVYWSGWRTLYNDYTITKEYLIPKNIFIESWIKPEIRYRAVDIIAAKIFNIYYIPSNTRSVYAPFIEPGDILLVKSSDIGTTEYLTDNIITVPAISGVTNFDTGLSMRYLSFAVGFQITVSFYLTDTARTASALFGISNPETITIKYFSAYIWTDSVTKEPLLSVHFGWNQRTYPLQNINLQDLYTLTFNFDSQGYIITGSLATPIAELWEDEEYPQPDWLTSLKIRFDQGFKSFRCSANDNSIEYDYVACVDTSNRYGLYDKTAGDFYYIPTASLSDVSHIKYIVPTLSIKTKGIHQMISEYTCNAT